ncbi:hypothetical protein ACIOD1_31520 [Streptomyces sp. NPDC088097]|uniref:hypothetical protein n=1 Tax=Streptomyces sp. NPDC088097 TaxID=3365823 RepID=UPI003806A729
MLEVVVTESTRRWDQRAVAVVRLIGTSTDYELFEAELQARDWPILECRPSSGAILEGDTGWHFTIEVRLLGSAIRAAAGAREHLEVVSDRLLLDLVVEAVQCVDRDPVYLPVWHAYIPLPAGSTASRAGRLWGRARARSEISLGSRDTGRQVRAGSEGEALSLAAQPLPGVPGPSAPVVLRRIGYVGRPESPVAWPRRREPLRRMGMMRFPALVGLVCGAWVAGLWGVGVLWAVLPAAVFLLGAARAGWLIARWALPELSGGQLLLAGLAGPMLATALGAFGVASAPDRLIGFVLVVYGIAVSYVVMTGVWLWVRQSRWRLSLPWLFPAFLAFLPAVFPGLGLLVPTLYLRAFGVDLEDIEVSAVMRLLTTLKFAAASLIWLVAPALLGYMRHTHHMISARWIGYVAASFVSACVLLMAWLGLVIGPAMDAGQRAVAASAVGRTPGHYYGIKPEWVCATPVRDLAQVPVDGGTLAPSRPYLSLGDAGGIVVLWDPQGNAALKVPLSALRLVPVDDPRRPCP